MRGALACLPLPPLGSGAGCLPLPPLSCVTFSMIALLCIGVLLQDDESLLEQDFAQPLCTKRGKCRESASSASPRTHFSSYTADQQNLWLAFQQTLAEEASLRGPAVQTLFLGDSITEAFRGTSYGRDCTTQTADDDVVSESGKKKKGRCFGVPMVFNEMFDPATTMASAISGDQTQHLLWRLQHGELPDSVQPKVAVVLIGTNK